MTKKQWTATLKDGSTATIRYMKKKEVRIVANLVKETLKELWGTTGQSTTFLNRQEKGKSKVILADQDNKIISFIEVEQRRKSWEVAYAYTIPGKRHLGANKCLNHLIIREVEGHIITSLAPKKEKILLKEYEELAKNAEINLEKEEGLFLNLYLEKTKNTNELLEKLLFDKFKLVYH